MSDILDIINNPAEEHPFIGLISPETKENPISLADQLAKAQELAYENSVTSLYQTGNYPDFPEWDLGLDRNEYLGMSLMWAEGVKDKLQKHDPETFELNKEYFDRTITEEARNLYRQKTNVNSNIASDIAGEILRGVVLDFGTSVVEGAEDLVSLAMRGSVSTSAKVADFFGATEWASRQRGYSKQIGEDLDQAQGERRQRTEDALDVIAPTRPDGGFVPAVARAISQGFAQVGGAIVTKPTQLFALAGQADQVASEAYNQTLELTGDKDKASKAYSTALKTFIGVSVPEFLLVKGVAGVFQAIKKRPTGILERILLDKKPPVKVAATVGALSEAAQETGEGAGARAGVTTAVDENESFVKNFIKEIFTEEGAQDAVMGGIAGGVIGGTIGYQIKKQVDWANDNIPKPKPPSKIVNPDTDITTWGTKDLEQMESIIKSYDEAIKTTVDGEVKDAFIAKREEALAIRDSILSQGQDLPSNADKDITTLVADLETQKASLEARRDALQNNQFADPARIAQLDQQIVDLEAKASEMLGTKDISKIEIVSNRIDQRIQEQSQREDLNPADFENLAEFNEAQDSQQADIVSRVQEEPSYVSVKPVPLFKGRPSTGKGKIDSTNVSKETGYEIDGARGELLYGLVNKERGVVSEQKGQKTKAFRLKELTALQDAGIETNLEGDIVKTKPKGTLEFTSTRTASELRPANPFTEKFLQTFGRKLMPVRLLADMSLATDIPLVVDGRNIRDKIDVNTLPNKQEIVDQIVDLKKEKSDIDNQNKLRAKEIKEVDNEATKIQKKIEALKSLKGAVSVVKAGNSRMVVDNSIDKDTVDFVGSILSGFNIGRPVVVTSAEMAKIAEFRESLGKEGVRVGQARSSKGRLSPTSYTVAQGLENDAIVLPDTDLTPRNAESILHEIGHIIGEDLIARNPGLAEKLLSEYNEFKKKGTVLERGANQKLPLRQEGDKGKTTKNQITYNEWLADNVARYIQNKNLQPKSAVQRFFKEFADSLRAIYNKLIGNKKLGLNRTIEKELDKFFNEGRMAAFLQNRGRVESAEGITLESVATKKEQEIAKNETNTDTATTPEDRSTLSEEDNAVLEKMLQDEGFKEESVEEDIDEESQSLARQFVEDYREFLKGDSPEKLAKNKLYQSLIRGKKLDEDAKKYYAQNAKKSHVQQSKEATLNEVQNFISTYGADKSLDTFFNDNASPLDFRIALGFRLADMLGIAARQAKNVGQLDIGKNLTIQLYKVVNKLTNDLAVESGRAVDMFKLAASMNNPAGIMHMAMKYLKRAAENNGETLNLKDSTIEKLTGLAEEVVRAKDAGSEVVASKLVNDMYGEVLTDMTMGLPSMLTRQVYLNMLSGPATTLLLNPVSNAFHHAQQFASLALVSPAIRKSYINGIKASYDKIPSRVGRSLAGRKSGTVLTQYEQDFSGKSQEQKFLEAKREELRKKQADGTITTKERFYKLGLEAYTPISRFQEGASLGLLQAGDDVFVQSAREVFIQAIAYNEVVKENGKLSSSDLQAKINEKLFNGKTPEEIRKTAIETVNKALTPEKKLELQNGVTKFGKTVVQSDLDALYDAEYYSILESNFTEQQIQEANHLADTMAFKNPPQGIIGAFGSGLLDVVRKGLQRTIKSENEIVKTLGILGESIRLKQAPFSNVIFNTTNFMIEASPLGILSLATDIATGIRDNKIEGKSFKDYLKDPYGITLVRNSKGLYKNINNPATKFLGVAKKKVSGLEFQRKMAYVGTANSLSLALAIMHLADFDPDDEDKVQFTGPRYLRGGSVSPQTSKILEGSGNKELSIIDGDKSYSYKELSFASAASILGSVEDHLRYSAKKIASPITGELKEVRLLTKEERDIYIRESVMPLVSIASQAMFSQIANTYPFEIFKIREDVTKKGFLEETWQGIKSLTALAIPLNTNLFSQLSALLEDERVDTRTGWGAFYANIPFAADMTGNKLYDFFADPIKKGTTDERMMIDRADENFKFLEDAKVFKEGYNPRKVYIIPGFDKNKEVSEIISHRQKQKELKIASTVANQYKQEEYLDLYLNHLGPYYKQYVEKARKDFPEINDNNRVEVNKEVNGNLEAIKDLAQREWLAKSYPELTRSLYSPKYQRKLNKILGRDLDYGM